MPPHSQMISQEPEPTAVTRPVVSTMQTESLLLRHWTAASVSASFGYTSAPSWMGAQEVRWVNSVICRPRKVIVMLVTGMVGEGVGVGGGVVGGGVVISTGGGVSAVCFAGAGSRLAVMRIITATITATTRIPPKMSCQRVFPENVPVECFPPPDGAAVAAAGVERMVGFTCRVPQCGQLDRMAENFFPQLRQVISGMNFKGLPAFLQAGARRPRIFF